MKPPVLTISLQPSHRLIMAMIGLHVLAIGAVSIADIDWAYRVLIVFAIVTSLITTLRQRSSVNLRCQSDGHLAVWAHDDWQPVRLLPDTVVLPWLIVLRYQSEERSRATVRVILSDCLAKSDFRHLRVWLRWRAVADTRAAFR